MDFSQIAMLLGAASVAGIIARIFKQPLLVGYLFAGFALAALGVIDQGESLVVLGKVGVALLLFLLGIDMKLSELPVIGKVALITGLGQILVTSTIGFIIARLLGYPVLPAVYIATALTFSSTIIIVKLLSEKNDLSSLYGRIIVGFLLVQDLIAILILMFLAGLSDGGFGLSGYFLVVAKGFGLLVSVWLLSKKVLPSIFSRIIDQSTELIFVAAVAWALGVAAFVGGPLGFSIEIGGFLAGLALSNLPDHLQISTRTRPLRDFFLTIFFIVLGTNLLVGSINQLILPVLVFSVFVLVGNPLIFLMIMGLMGYRKRTSFMASVTTAQVSEFSLILMAMGLSAGHILEAHAAVVVLVGVITMTLSTYLILGADRIYSRLEKILSIFERKKPAEIHLSEALPKKGHIVLVGSHRTGATLLPLLKKSGRDYVVVDFNPSLASRLIDDKVPVLFGDITDIDILESANVLGAKLVISTTSDFHDSLALLSYLKRGKSKAAIVLKASSKNEAIALYKKGADYVIVPEILAGEYIRHLFSEHAVSGGKLIELGKSHLKRLQRLN